MLVWLGDFNYRIELDYDTVVHLVRNFRKGDRSALANLLQEVRTPCAIYAAPDCSMVTVLGCLYQWTVRLWRRVNRSTIMLDSSCVAPQIFLARLAWPQPSNPIRISLMLVGVQTTTCTSRKHMCASGQLNECCPAGPTAASDCPRRSVQVDARAADHLPADVQVRQALPGPAGVRQQRETPRARVD